MMKTMVNSGLKGSSSVLHIEFTTETDGKSNKLTACMVGGGLTRCDFVLVLKEHDRVNKMAVFFVNNKKGISKSF